MGSKVCREMGWKTHQVQRVVLLAVDQRALKAVNETPIPGFVRVGLALREFLRAGGTLSSKKLLGWEVVWGLYVCI